MNTLLDVLNKGTDYLSKHNVEEARRVMELLLTHVLECDRLALYMNHEDILSESQLTPLRALLKRKAAGEPVQHLIGSTEFYGRNFRSDNRALIPRQETEELVELILQKAPQDRPLSILDMGTGSGIIGITLALELKIPAEITLVDISEKALSLALENALSHRVKVNALRGDLFTAFSDYTEPPAFDIIAANLPYIAQTEEPLLSKEVHHDPATALYGGSKGYEIIYSFLEQAPLYLKHSGFVALEIGYDQADLILNKLTSLRFQKPEVFSDLAGIQRFPIAYAPTF